MTRLVPYIDGAYMRTTDAGLVWFQLQWHERRYPFDDDQVALFDLPPSGSPRSTRFGERRERIERAVKLLAGGHFELRTGDYRYDIGFDRSRKIVRVATRALADVYEAAVYMGHALTSAGEIDWRATEMMPEDYYAA